MSMLHLFRWFSHTWISHTLRDSTWGFAIVEVGHLLALAILGGAILIVDLRLLGLGLRRQSVSVVTRSLYPLLLAGILLMVLSGVFLVATDPMKYYGSPAFRIKMLLLAGAIAIHFAVHFGTAKSDVDRVTPLWAKAAAILSLLLWFSVGLAGRAIGFI